MNNGVPPFEGVSAWFAGPKAENGDAFAHLVSRIVHDHYAWRRNYFPEDGFVVDSHLRRASEPFADQFDDRLWELLARLKADPPFQSPRYAAHMVSEQTLPSIAGYFAAMLYNPNNVTAESAPVTVRLELEAAAMIAQMMGYDETAWAHLTSGGTVANLEALWVTRSVKYLPFALRQARSRLGLPTHTALARGDDLFGLSPAAILGALADTWSDAEERWGAPKGYKRVAKALWSSRFNPATQGTAQVIRALGSKPRLFVPETYHYCFTKCMDVLGLGTRSLHAVPVDRHFRMDVGALAEALDATRAAGDHVLAVVAVAGTTEEGAIDPVDGIVALRNEREAAGLGSFWLHVDAAYGGYLRTMILPERIGLGEPTTESRIAGRSVSLPLSLPDQGACDALGATGHADSVTVDPHKLGFIPYPAGAICFKSPWVKAVARQDAPYLEDDPDKPRAGEQSIGVYVLEGSKPGAAAAGVWLSHSLIALDASQHGRMLRDQVRAACEFHALLEAYPCEVECKVRAHVLCPPGSNIVCYLFAPAEGGMPLKAINRFNRRIHQAFDAGPGSDQRVFDRRFFVSRTTLSAERCGPSAVGGLLERLGATPQDYAESGVFLMRSVMMSPWYELAKQRGRFFVAELVEALYGEAERALG